MTTLTAAPAAPSRAHAQPPPLPFSRLLRVEWGKTVGTRAARWLLATVAVMILLAMLIPAAFSDDIDQTRTIYLSFAALGGGLLMPIVPLLALTSEWTQRTVLVTFTQEPRRGRVLGAKLLVGATLGTLAGLFSLAVALATVAAMGAGGRTVHGDEGWLALSAGLVLFSLLNVSMGMAFGALLHNSAAAIVLFFMLPTLWGVIFAVEALNKVGEWVDTSQTFTWVLEADWSGHTGQIVTSMLLWIVLPLAAGLVRTVRREVS